MTEKNCKDVVPESKRTDSYFETKICNGFCIPSIIPCNNTCMDIVDPSTNKSEKLFGPTSCTLLPKKSSLFNFQENFILHGNLTDFLHGVATSDSDYFWTGGIETHLIPEVIKTLGNAESQLGVCLPGNIRSVHVWKIQSNI